MKLLLGLVLTLGLRAACTPLYSDRITAADVSRVIPEFAALAPDTPLAFAPRFGVRRDLPLSELRRWARAAHLSLARSEGLCFERQGRILTPAEIRAALPIPPEWSVELLGDQFAGRPAPLGQIEFLRTALPRQAPLGVVLWKGRILDAAGTSHPFWIRVRLAVEQRVVRARVALRPGDFLGDSQIESVALRRYPFTDGALTDPAALGGRRIRRAVAAGQVLHASDLLTPRDIERGDLVDVRMEEALLRVEAESPGRTGELVLLKNPLNGKRFQARVTGPRAAAMTPPKP